MNLRDAQINLDTIGEQRRKIGQDHFELQTESSQLKAKNENLERELFSKKELLKSVEEQQRFYVRRLKEDNEKLQKKSQNQCDGTTNAVRGPPQLLCQETRLCPPTP